MKILFKRYAVRVMALVSLMLLLGSWSSAAEPTGKLTIALAAFSFEETLPWEGSVAGHSYWAPMYDFMFYVDEKGNVTPGLVTSWTESADGLTWEFIVRKGVKFHNGEELTARDIVYTLERMSSKDSVHSAGDVLKKVLKSVEAVDPYKVKLYLKKRLLTLPIILSWQQSVPILPYNLEAKGTDFARKHPIGTGPYKFVSRKKGEYIRYEALDRHWRKVPHYKDLELRLVPEDFSRLAMLRRRDVDIAGLPLAFKSEAEKAGLKTWSIKQMMNVSVAFWGIFTPDRPGYDKNYPPLKKEVRQALNLAIDRKEIAKSIMYGEAEPSQLHFLLPWQRGWNPEWKPYPYNPKKAKELLAQAGYPNGFKIKMYLSMGKLAEGNELGQAIAMYLEKVGINVEIELAQWSALRPKVRKAELSGIYPMANGPLDTATFWPIIYIKPYHFFEISPELNKLLLQDIPNAKNSKEQIEAIQKAGDVMISEYVQIPIITLNSTFTANDKVGKWPVKPHNAGLNSVEYISP